MRSLMQAREGCDRFHPGLLAALEKVPLHRREAADSPVVEIYRRHGGAGLLAPTEYGGLAADPVQAVRVLRALSAVSPSLGVAATMHHFTVGMLFSLAATADRLTAGQLKTLSSIALDGLLLASGWAEGRTNQNILVPSVVAQPVADGYVVNGIKKPCSLSASMDILTASVTLTDGTGRAGLALLLIPADAPGVGTAPFWASPILAGAQSNEVTLRDVHVPEELVIRSTPEDEHRLDDLQTAGFAWFELLATATYVGAASALVQRVSAGQRGTPQDRAGLSMRLEAAVNLLEGTARTIADHGPTDESVAAVLVARYAIQDLLTEVSDAAVELLGGLAFMRSFDIAYLSAAVRVLAFHPPSRASAAVALAGYLDGGPLDLS